MELDAEISGSDSADEPSSDNESESDRRFVNDFQATQAPNGYNQQAAYVAGLATQALGKRGGPSFAPRERTQKFLAKARKPMMVTDDDRSEGEASHNEYELGSFVCDDEELEFAPSSEFSLSN
jgi:ATP-dependent DNA helicase MPH1